MTAATPVAHTPRQIVLVGLSGVGKSTVGRALAERLGWEYVDTDDLVTAREGKTPADLITSRGEPAFRDIEARVVTEAARRESVVIATGGGAFQRGVNRRALGERGLICFLDATPTEIARRLRADAQASPRPLVDGDLDANLARLDAERRPTYNHADLWVPVQGAPEQREQTCEAAVARILRAWATEGTALLARPRRLERLGLDEPARGPAAVVDTGAERYPIWVAAGELRRLPDRLRQIGLDGRRVFLISDTAVIEAHGRTVAEALDSAGTPGASYVIPAGESSKTQRTASEIYSWLAGERAERRDVILALGGGVVGDLAGYVAATYLRGMPVVQLPTSVLAMNDAAIGGKVAIDLPAGKNLVGAFHQPAAVISDIETLRTLPRRSYIEGFAEVIKHALILDPALLALLERESARIASPAPDLDLVAQVVAQSSRLKALIVSNDPEERGIRAILNYGHTTGHGIEQATQYTQYMHGEAVSVGMMAAGRIGVELGTMEQALLDRQADLLRAFGLPTAAPGVNATAVLDAMKRDKKVEQGKLRFVLLEGPGLATVRGDVPQELVERTVQSVLRG